MITLHERPVPNIQTDSGFRVVIRVGEVAPEPVMRYVKNKFGDRLDEPWSARTSLAVSYDPEILALEAFKLYEKFRPEIPGSKRGRGRMGDLDLGIMGQLLAD